MEEQQTIWAASGKGLGDCWASVCYVLRQSVKNNRTELMAPYYRKGPVKKRWYVNKVKEMLPLLDTTGSIEIVEADPTRKLTWKEVYKIDYFPTKPVWTPSTYKKICYQFDGKSHGCKNISSPEKEQELIDHIESNGFCAIRLGCEQTLAEAVELLSESAMFIGVESGFAHIAASTGIPIFMIVNGRTYQGIQDSHTNREMVLCNDADDALLKLTDYFKQDNYYEENKVLIT